MNKNNSILTRNDIAKILKDYQKQGKKIAFTSGVFDLLHSGHVQYLAEAKALGDILIVGVNSDSSVRENKGPLRPIQDEISRATIVCNLKPVDHVFIFSEKNNNKNIEELKPDIYVKAGDYDRSKLSSAGIVESYGGRVEFVSFKDGHSSTSLVDTIIDRYLPKLADHQSYPLPDPKPGILIDRDGTICKHVEYLSDPSQFELLPGVIEGLKFFQDAGFRLAIITNQPGIGLGYFSKEDFYRVNKEMLKQLSLGGILIDKIYFSPYSKRDKTSCRKPATLLGERAIEELNLIREKCWMIGDTTTDIAFAKNLGIKGCLVKTGQSGEDGLYEVKADLEVTRFDQAAKKIISN